MDSGNKKQVKDLPEAIDCESQNRTRKIMDRFKNIGKISFTENAAGHIEISDKDFDFLKKTVEKFNKLETAKKTVFDEIDKTLRDPKTTQEAKQAFYSELQPGGKYNGRQKSGGVYEALDDIRERYLPGRHLEELKAKEIAERLHEKNGEIDEQLKNGEISKEKLIAKHEPGRSRYYVPDVVNDKWDLSEEIKKQGGLCDDGKKQWYFTDQKKAQEAFRLIDIERTRERANERTNENEEPTRHYIREKHYLEADAKDVARIEKVLNMPKKDGGLGFLYDEKRRQWFTYDPEDLKKAKNLMDTAREKENKQGFSMDIKALIGELRNIEKEVAHKM